MHLLLITLAGLAEVAIPLTKLWTNRQPQELYALTPSLAHILHYTTKQWISIYNVLYLHVVLELSSTDPSVLFRTCPYTSIYSHIPPAPAHHTDSHVYRKCNIEHFYDARWLKEANVSKKNGTLVGKSSKQQFWALWLSWYVHVAVSTVSVQSANRHIHVGHAHQTRTERSL